MTSKRPVTILINDITLPAGTERAVVNLANNLAGHGHEVEIVSVYTRSGESFYALGQGVSLTHGGLRLLPSAARRFATMVPAVICMAARRRSRLLIGTNHAVNIALAVSKRLGLGAGHIACEHVVYEAAPRYARGLRRRLYPGLDRVVVLTVADENQYRRLDHLENLSVIPNELPFWPAAPSTGDTKRMIAIGHLAERKGFDLLIDAVADVLRSEPEWSLVIVGEGEAKAALQQQIARHGLDDQIRLMSPTRNVEGLYLSSSIYLMSSRSEAFGMVLIEAQACGLPIVAYDCPSGPGEIVTPGSGFLIPMGNSLAYGKAVRRLIADQDLRRHMGANARKAAVRYTSETVYRQWERILESLP